MSTKLDARQSVLRASQPMIGSASNDSLDTLFPKIDAEMAKLFEDRNVLLTDGGIITFTGTTVTFTESLKLAINSQVAGGSPTIIDLGSSTRTVSASGRMIYAVIDRGLGTATITDDATTLPAVTSANQEVFLIAKRVDTGGALKRLYFRTGMALDDGQSSRLGSGAGGSSPISFAGFQDFVDDSAVLTPFNGSPSAGQFRTFGIVGRASIPDITNDLIASMGVDGIVFTQLYELREERGPNNEKIFGSINDSSNLVRFVGSWESAINQGPYVRSNTVDDYIEVVFFGTALNILVQLSATDRDMRATVDGGSEGSNFYPTSAANVQVNRKYASNNRLPVVSGLSLGLHTVKLRIATASAPAIYGFEFINEASSINVQTGSGYRNGLQYSTASPQTVAYNSSFDSILRDGSSVGSLGTKGARVLLYQNSDGTIGKSAIEPDSSSLTLSSTDHSNEEIIRTYHFREFGTDYSADLTILPVASNQAGSGAGGGINAAYVLDDGITAMLVTNTWVFTGTSGKEGFAQNSNNDFVLFTFVGTGLDIGIVGMSGAGPNTATVFVDGTNIGTGAIANSTVDEVIPIVSGLAYGTHVVQFKINSAVATALYFEKFIVYGPKKPALPNNTVELAEYNIVGDFSANSTPTFEFLSAGVIRANTYRNSVFVGTGWTFAGVDSQNPSGLDIYTSTNGDYVEHTFFGTGFDVRFGNGAWIATLAVDGATNLSGFTTSFYGSGFTYVDTTGAIASTGGDNAQGITISGLTLGIHTIRITRGATGASVMAVEVFDIITPIHVPLENRPAVINNSLTIGSRAIADLRNLTPVKGELEDRWAQAFGIDSSPSTTSSLWHPVPDMSATVDTKTGLINAFYSASFTNSNNPIQCHFAIFVDGIQVSGTKELTIVSAGNWSLVSDSMNIRVNPGVHKVAIYWNTAGNGLSINGMQRNLTINTK